MSEQALLDKMATTIDALPASIDQLGKGYQSALDKVVAELKEAIPKAPAAKTEDPAREGALTGFTKMEIMGLPLGQIVIGSFGGIFVSELVDGFMAAQGDMAKGVVKLVMAGVVGKWGTRIMSKEASLAIALVLGVFGISQIVPIDKWAAKLASTIRGALLEVPGTIKVTGMDKGIMGKVQKVAEDYYAGLGGGR